MNQQNQQKPRSDSGKKLLWLLRLDRAMTTLTPIYSESEKWEMGIKKKSDSVIFAQYRAQNAAPNAEKKVESDSESEWNHMSVSWRNC